ncbi:GABA-specific permease [[Candida] railenensis]|uniref:GABA-specific permease n=1 Tax=[Candida] railenensis TaxID=45579 RepID=A0A9P0QMI4_9ASCO|nr:GABA-specific permease [[Candida] railenensis]
MPNLKAVKSTVSLHTVRSKAGDHVHQVLSNRSELRVLSVDAGKVGDEDLLADIGYKQELNRSYSTIQIFGIAFSIMGLLPSIASTIGSGLDYGAVGLTWGWFCSGFFILSIGVSMSILSSAIPTSGGLYYWTNYYAPDNMKVILSFLIGCSNSMGLISGFCSINYGFASEIASAVYISKDGDFDITNPILYGIFAACCVSHIALCCATSKHTAYLQSFSIYINVFIIVLFIIAVPIGASKKNGFNDSSFIFGNTTNETNWTAGWSFMLSWMPAIWTIGAFDSCVHMSEEAKNATRGVPIGIIGSITVCWVIGWIICIVACACMQNGDVDAVVSPTTGQSMAQIIYDCLGKEWAVAFMSLIAFAQYVMGASILTAASRQIWAFARDDGLPFHSYVKVINPTLKVPLRATIFGGLFGLIIGLLILIDETAASALFSLAVASNYLSWGMPVFLVLLPHGSKKFKPGYFTLGKVGNTIVHCITVVWIVYVIIMSMFPSSKTVDKETMNYTVVINVGVWILALVYYFVYGYKVFSGPKSNLEGEHDGSVDEDLVNIDAQLLEDKS